MLCYTDLFAVGTGAAHAHAPFVYLNNLFVVILVLQMIVMTGKCPYDKLHQRQL